MASFWDDRFQREKFESDLRLAEYRATSDTATKFVEDMRRLAKSNDDLKSMGVEPWEPSAKQLNYLQSLARG